VAWPPGSLGTVGVGVGDLSPPAVPLMRVHFNSPTEMTITEQKEILVRNASKRLSRFDQPRLYPLCLALVLGRGSKRGQLDGL
jgi:hypothetical protein